MNIIQAIILGIIQGLTEFLPVSSSGHLVLFQKIFGVTGPTLAFDTFVHVGTLAAIFVVFWKDIAAILKKPFQRITWLLIAGSIPTGIIGLAFNDFFEKLYDTGITLGYEFFLTGLVLLLAERLNSGKKNERTASYLDAAFVGAMQGAAILPAVSRSGLTISGALLRGFDKDFAAKFSFLLSIPAILAATALHAKKMVEIGGLDDNLIIYAAGTLAAALSGYLSIKLMLEVLKKGKLKYFSYYVFILGALVLLDQYLLHIFFK
ncbi:MAG: undecaprenyl-diphosphate phosphatase [Bacillota bacterium]